MLRRLTLAFGFVMIVSMTAIAATQTMGGTLKNIRMNEPRFEEIMREAYRHEHLEWAPVLEWRKKMKQAPWLPTLAVGYDRALRETNALSISDNISVSSGEVTVGPADNDRDQTLFQGDSLRFRAVWDLDELVFHSSELQAHREKREMMRDRLFFSDHVYKVYAERRQLMAEYFRLKGVSPAKAGLLREKVLDLTDRLDFFTDGAFAGRWWRGDP